MSQAHIDLAAPRLAALSRPPEALFDDVPPIMRLPFELTILIFRNCDPDVTSRLRLAHTSRSWMEIASQTASLWTLVHLVITYPAKGERFDRLLLLLEMQLDRAAGMPLDVVWASNQPSGFHPRLIGLLRRKGPFCRWKTLQLSIWTSHLEDEPVFSPEDAFGNLESISISRSILTCVITALNRTTTSRLQVLEHQWPYLPRLEDCTGMIRHISCLRTDKHDIGPLSNNITQLEARIQSYHDFPHLETYKLKSCDFRNERKIDLRCLTTLEVTEELFILPHCEVSLPSLRNLRCGAISLMAYAKISAPTLAKLYICGEGNDVEGNNTSTDRTMKAIRHPGYLLSPSSLLSVGMLLPDDALGKLLELSSRVSTVEMSFSNEGCAIRVLDRISMADTPNEGEAVWLCEQLTELRLNFLWGIADVASWRDRAARVVENRLRAGTLLRVYSSWKGEGTYVLLA